MQDFLRRTEDSKKHFKDYFNIRMGKNKKLIRLFGKTIFDNSRKSLPIESSAESKSAESANEDSKNMDSEKAESSKIDSIKANSSAHATNTAKSASKNKSQIFYILRDITESGGGERVCANLANALIERGKSVHIISLFCLNEKPCYALDPRIPITYLSHTSPSCTSPNAAKSLKKLWIKLVYRWILCLKACGIINAYARQALAGTSAHADTITALGNDGWFIPLRKLKIKGKNAIKYARIWHIQAPKKARKALSFFDFIIILSPRQIATWRTFHKHIKVIPNFLPNLPSKTTNHAQRRILAVGRLTEQKAFLRLLDIWAMVRARIAGDGVEKLRAKAESSADSSAKSSTDFKADSSALDLSLRAQSAKQSIKSSDSIESAEPTNTKSSQNSLTYVRDWQLVIVGDGVQKAQLEQKIIDKHLQDSVMMKPFTSDIESEYLSASIYALSSRNEGFPMVLVEASSYALPSVAFDVDSGPSDIIDDGVNGYLVKDGDLSVFAERLLVLMSNEAKRESMGNKARTMMQERFGKETIMRLWDEALG